MKKLKNIDTSLCDTPDKLCLYSFQIYRVLDNRYWSVVIPFIIIDKLNATHKNLYILIVFVQSFDALYYSAAICDVIKQNESELRIIEF